MVYFFDLHGTNKNMKLLNTQDERYIRDYYMSRTYQEIADKLHVTRHIISKYVAKNLPLKNKNISLAKKTTVKIDNTGAIIKSEIEHCLMRIDLQFKKLRSLLHDNK